MDQPSLETAGLHSAVETPRSTLRVADHERRLRGDGLVTLSAQLTVTPLTAPPLVAGHPRSYRLDAKLIPRSRRSHSRPRPLWLILVPAAPSPSASWHSPSPPAASVARPRLRPQPRVHPRPKRPRASTTR